MHDLPPTPQYERVASGNTLALPAVLITIAVVMPILAVLAVELASDHASVLQSAQVEAHKVMSEHPGTWFALQVDDTTGRPCLPTVMGTMGANTAMTDVVLTTGFRRAMAQGDKWPDVYLSRSVGGRESRQYYISQSPTGSEPRFDTSGDGASLKAPAPAKRKNSTPMHEANKAKRVAGAKGGSAPRSVKPYHQLKERARRSRAAQFDEFLLLQQGIDVGNKERVASFLMDQITRLGVYSHVENRLLHDHKKRHR